MTVNRVLFAAGGVLVGLMLAQMLGVASLTSKFGLGTAAAA
jgi:hypothetical protein